jgi:hypothetical protein
MTIHIYAPKPSDVRLRVHECFRCKRRRRFLHEFIEWYGWSFICLACGEMWGPEGWHYPNPPGRGQGWRQERIDAAKARYERWRE